MKRSVLFLQGPCTPFFAHLANRLATDGHAVNRIHFCAGDVAFWNNLPAWRFRGDSSRLEDFLDEKYRRFGITDQILFGDRRPVHRPALDMGRARGVRTHVFEEGYFRPWWITLEREGVNGHSPLPRDPDWYRTVSRGMKEPVPPLKFHSPFRSRALFDVIYHVAGSLNPVLFPGYKTHAPVTAPIEYAGYLGRFARLSLIRARERQRVMELIASGKRFFFLPLQLNGDAQIRHHSRFEHMGEAIEFVMESFARQAPADSMLVFKNHPLDMGLMDFGKIVRTGEQRYRLEGRTAYLEDGDLSALLRHAEGVVTVNSTVGLMALELGRPVLTLSDPIYNLPGLTFQGGLDDFWKSAAPPDADLFDRFHRVVMRATQINGGYYCKRGIALAVENSARVLMAKRSPLEALL